MFKLINFDNVEIVEEAIEICQKRGDIQQVAYSTYHGCLTQVCFTCKKIRTNISKKDISKSDISKNDKSLVSIAPLEEKARKQKLLDMRGIMEQVMKEPEKIPVIRREDLCLATIMKKKDFEGESDFLEEVREWDLM